MKTIIANFKMNKTFTETKDYLMTLVPRYDERHELVLCMPYTSIAL